MPTIWDHVLAALCGVIAPAIGVWQQRKLTTDEGELEPFTTRAKIAVYWSNSAVLWILAGAAVLAWWWAERTFASLGLTAAPERWAVGGALAGAVLVLYAADVWWNLATSERRAEARERWQRDTPFMPETGREVAHSLVLVTSAAIGEEIVFRGFLVSYVTSFAGVSLGGLAAAIALPALVFAACHTYQGVHAVGKIFVGAVLFGALFVVTGSLWIPIALHFVVDIVGSGLGPRLMGEQRRPEHLVPTDVGGAQENGGGHGPIPRRSPAPRRTRAGG